MTSNRFRLVVFAALLAASLACGGERVAAEPEGGAAASAPAASGDGNQPAPDAPAAAPPAGAAAPVSAAPQDPNATVASVNGVKIPAKELHDAIGTFLQGQGIGAEALAPEQATQVRQIVLDALIGSEILFQKSRAEGMAPTVAEIDAAIADAKKNFPDEAAFQAQLQQRGLTLEGMRTMIARNLAIDKIIKRDVLEQLAVTEEEAKAYWKEHPAEMQKEEEVRASHILYRFPEGAGEEAKAPAKAKAVEALKRVKAGEDFAALAKASSEDPGTAARGGDLGFFKKGAMVPPFESAAFALPVGQISDVVESPFGFHVIKVTDRHAGGTAPYEEVSESLKGFLKQKKARDQMQAYLATLRSTATVETF